MAISRREKRRNLGTSLNHLITLLPPVGGLKPALPPARSRTTCPEGENMGTRIEIPAEAGAGTETTVGNETDLEEKVENQQAK